MHQNDDEFWEDIERVLSRNGRADAQPGPEDFDFDFDSMYPEQPPQPPVRSDRFSVDSMRRVHEGAPVAPTPPAPRRQAQKTEYAPKHTKKRKKRGFLRRLRNAVLILLLLLALVVGGFLLYVKMPQSEQPISARKPGCASILICGTDLEGVRTDSMMLLFIDREAKSLRLLSLPRDTMVNRDNPVPKLNGAYGANGEGEKGMGFLMDYVRDLVGYRPDGYMLVDLNCFSALVDQMGGVKFDVPMAMQYDDPSQDLHIDLSEGSQLLSGLEAMWVMRFRSGYTMADLDRVDVQRSFLFDALKQWAKPSKLFRLPGALRLLKNNTLTDLSSRNLCWIALSAALCASGGVASDTLPGEPKYVDGGAYYVEDRAAAARLINERYNPYEKEISADDLHPYGY